MRKFFSFIFPTPQQAKMTYLEYSCLITMFFSVNKREEHKALETFV